MPSDTKEREPIGVVEVDAVLYVIVETISDHYQVLRLHDKRRVGAFRGSPTSMWLLEPENVEIDLLHAIVQSAIAEGLLVDIPSD